MCERMVAEVIWQILTVMARLWKRSRWIFEAQVVYHLFSQQVMEMTEVLPILSGESLADTSRWICQELEVPFQEADLENIQNPYPSH